MRWLLVLFVVLVGCAPKGAPLRGQGDARPPERAVAAPVAEVRAAAMAFEADTGVKLHVYGLPGDGAPRVGHGVIEGPVDLALVPRAVPVIERVVETYPPDFRAELLSHVWIVGRLRALGHPFLGMARPRQARLDLAIHPRTSPDVLEGTAHHEIAHLIMGLPGFDRLTWRAFSNGSYVGREPNKKWPKEGRPWLEHGFVERYSSKNPAEDWATLAEAAFAHPKQLLTLADRYDLIRKKLDFLTRTYELLVPGARLPWLER